MRLTARQLNRATLGRQLLLERQPLGVAEAVRHLVALQAQHAASPYLALWNRLVGFDAGELDAAFATGALVKATLLRITLHAVHAGDHPTFRDAMQPTLRGSRFGDRRFAAAGLTVAEADALVPDLLAFAEQPRTVAELEAWLEGRHGRPVPGLWWALRSVASLRHAPTGGPWSFGLRPSFVAARPGSPGSPGRRAAGWTEEDRSPRCGAGGRGPDGGSQPVPSAGRAERSGATSDEALQVLARRYLAAFGPASVADLAQFAMVQRGRARAALGALAGELEHVDGPDGKPLVDVPGAPLPAEDTPAPPRLMAMWDSCLLAYHDRSRVIPPQYRSLVTRVNGDVLPTLLVDGHVAGVWRAVENGIEATAFHRLPAQAWDGLAAEARALHALLADRDPFVFRRYDHWWAKLPGGDVRVLPGG